MTQMKFSSIPIKVSKLEIKYPENVANFLTRKQISYVEGLRSLMSLGGTLNNDGPRNQVEAQCEVASTTSSRSYFESQMDNLFKEALELLKKKNSDYTKIDPNNPLLNFQQRELGIYLRNKGIHDIDDITLSILERLNEKRQRIFNIIFTGEQNVLDESIEDTLIDNANLSFLLLYHLKSSGKLRFKLSKEKEVSSLVEEIAYLRDKLNSYDHEIKELLHFKANHLENRLKRNRHSKLKK